jgi:hypothetical protein
MGLEGMAIKVGVHGQVRFVSTSISTLIEKRLHELGKQLGRRQSHGRIADRKPSEEIDELVFCILMHTLLIAVEANLHRECG